MCAMLTFGPISDAERWDHREPRGKCVMFTVIDLASQARESARHVNGWSRAAILDLLRANGVVERIQDDPDVETFVFTSHTGMSARISFSRDGSISLLARQHSGIYYIESFRIDR